MDHRRLIQNLIGHIENHLDDEVSITRLAAEAGLSPWHFQRLFRSLTGDTLGGYVRGRRLTRAAQLLLNSEDGILAIALACGFTSQAALTRSFRQVFGLTPGAFRRQRPAVQLQKKPLLSAEHLYHRWHELHTEPQIFMRPALQLIGILSAIPSPFISAGSYCHLMESAWRELLARQQEIAPRQEDTFLGLSISPGGDFSEEQLQHLAAVPIPAAQSLPADALPAGMMALTLPAQKVAAFHVSAVNPDTVNKTIDYIYGSWLPNSAEQRGHGHDYEWFEQVDSFRRPPQQSLYVIPLR